MVEMLLGVTLRGMIAARASKSVLLLLLLRVAVLTTVLLTTVVLPEVAVRAASGGVRKL